MDYVHVWSIQILQIHTQMHTSMLYRWLRSWNILMASERKQRELAQDITGGLKGELVSFSFPDQRRGHIMQLAPYVWVEDLEQKITETTEYNHQ